MHHYRPTNELGATVLGASIFVPGPMRFPCLLGLSLHVPLQLQICKLPPLDGGQAQQVCRRGGAPCVFVYVRGVSLTYSLSPGPAWWAVCLCLGQYVKPDPPVTGLAVVTWCLDRDSAKGKVGYDLPGSCRTCPVRVSSWLTSFLTWVQPPRLLVSICPLGSAKLQVSWGPLWVTLPLPVHRESLVGHRDRQLGCPQPQCTPSTHTRPRPPSPGLPPFRVSWGHTGLCPPGR